MIVMHIRGYLVFLNLAWGQNGNGENKRVSSQEKEHEQESSFFITRFVSIRPGFCWSGLELG